jgi:hypothetical protein
MYDDIDSPVVIGTYLENGTIKRRAPGYTRILSTYVPRYFLSRRWRGWARPVEIGLCLCEGLDLENTTERNDQIETRHPVTHPQLSNSGVVWDSVVVHDVTGWKETIGTTVSSSRQRHLLPFCDHNFLETRTSMNLLNLALCKADPIVPSVIF